MLVFEELPLEQILQEHTIIPGRFCLTCVYDCSKPIPIKEETRLPDVNWQGNLLKSDVMPNLCCAIASRGRLKENLVFVGSNTKTGS